METHIHDHDPRFKLHQTLTDLFRNQSAQALIIRFVDQLMDFRPEIAEHGPFPKPGRQNQTDILIDLLRVLRPGDAACCRIDIEGICRTTNLYESLLCECARARLCSRTDVHG
jgi:hypothetical protein